MFHMEQTHGTKVVLYDRSFKKEKETRNVSMGNGCPNCCQIRINREFPLTKDNNSLKHGVI